MPESRTSVALRVGDAVGPEVLQITDAQNGWPALGRLLVGEYWVDVALFVGPVTSGGRPDRETLERRFQNPGPNRPIQHVPGRVSLLIGLWTEDSALEVDRPLIVLADANRRVGLPTRYSVFATVEGLAEALATGWSSIASGADEVIRCFDARLLPVAVEAAGISGAAGIEDEDVRIRDVIDGAGLTTDADAPAAARARRAAWTIIRDRRFSALVRGAYEGLCALCGLGFDLTQGAHIYPASAPGSRDEVWNGLALCPNHHAAFDRHLLFIDPVTRKVTFHPDLLKSVAAATLIATSASALAEPLDPGDRPSPKMFEARYKYYGDRYDWV